jgi:hypothetical protein
MGTSAHCPRNLIEACVMLATQRARRPVAAAWACARLHPVWGAAADARRNGISFPSFEA